MSRIDYALLVLTSWQALPLATLTVLAWFYCSDYYMIPFFPHFSVWMDDYLFIAFPLAALFWASWRIERSSKRFRARVSRNVRATVSDGGCFISGDDRFTGATWAAVLRALNRQSPSGKERLEWIPRAFWRLTWTSVWLRWLIKRVAKQDFLRRHDLFVLKPGFGTWSVAMWFPLLIVLLIWTAFPSIAIEAWADSHGCGAAGCSAAIWTGKCAAARTDDPRQRDPYDLADEESPRFMSPAPATDGYACRTNERSAFADVDAFADDFPRSRRYVKFTPRVPSGYSARNETAHSPVRNGTAHYGKLFLDINGIRPSLTAQLFDAAGTLMDTKTIEWKGDER